MKNFRSVELFAGAAGLGLGLAKSGFHHEIVIENDSDACETIRLNQRNGYPLVQGWEIKEANIEDCDLSEIKGEVDLVAGGPPCQGFSIGGKHKGHSDNRNLWPWAIKSVADLKPKAFVFENVPNLASSHKAYLDYLQKALSLPTLARPEEWVEDTEALSKIIKTGQTFDPSYNVTVETHVSTNYGTGQKRKRLFIIGTRSDISGRYVTPKATHSYDELMTTKWITGEYWDRHCLQRPMPDDEAARWIRKHNRQERDLFCERLQPWNTVRDIISQIPQNAANHEAAPREAKSYKGHTGSYIDAPAKTHRAGDHGVSGGEMMIDMGESSNGTRYRHYTTREAAALSDFDHDYEFHGSWGDCLRQIGNCVPVNMSENIGKSIMKALAA